MWRVLRSNGRRLKRGFVKRCDLREKGEVRMMFETTTIKRRQPSSGCYSAAQSHGMTGGIPARRDCEGHATCPSWLVKDSRFVLQSQGLWGKSGCAEPLSSESQGQPYGLSQYFAVSATVTFVMGWDGWTRTYHVTSHL